MSAVFCIFSVKYGDSTTCFWCRRPSQFDLSGHPKPNPAHHQVGGAGSSQRCRGYAFHRICANRYEVGVANSRPPSLPINLLNCAQASFYSPRCQKRPAGPQRVLAGQNHPSRSAHAATRDNVFARHPARVVRRRKHCDRRDVIRLAQPAERSLAERPCVKVRSDYP